MVESTPAQSLAVTLQGGQFKLAPQEAQTAGPNEVVIKMAYSVVNPYDRDLFYMRKDEGFKLGCEGCGTIVEVGEGVS